MKYLFFWIDALTRRSDNSSKTTVRAGNPRKRSPSTRKSDRCPLYLKIICSDRPFVSEGMKKAVMMTPIKFAHWYKLKRRWKKPMHPRLHLMQNVWKKLPSKRRSLRSWISRDLRLCLMMMMTRRVCSISGRCTKIRSILDSVDDWSEFCLANKIAWFQFCEFWC